jgi:aminopeptidase N
MDRSDIVKPQDLFSWYVSMLRNRRARSKTWGWLVDHWTWIDQTFSGDKSYDLFPRCAGQILDNQVDLANYQDFFGSKTAEPALKRAIEIGLNDISARVAWIDRDQAAVLDKLRSKK